MSWANIGIAIVGAVAQDINTPGQVSGTIPQPRQPGASLGVGGGQDFSFSDDLQNILQEQPDLESLVGEQGKELFPQVRANEPVTSLPSVFNTDAQNTDLAPQGTEGFVGPSNIVAGDETLSDEQLGPFAKFFGNLDQNLQSPSKLLGLSLLSNIDPRLAQAGLFAGGLFGENKLFGGK